MKLYTLQGWLNGSGIPVPLVINLDTICQINLGDPANASPAGNQLVFTLNNGTTNGTTTVAYIANNPGQVLQEINDLANGVGGALVSQDYGLNPILLSVTPTNIHDAAGSTIQITGANFSASTLGTVHIEDFAGGMDSNDVSFTPTYIDSQHLSAVWASDGGGGCPKGPVVMLYYEDSSGKFSNPLFVTLY